MKILLCIYRILLLLLLGFLCREVNIIRHHFCDPTYSFESKTVIVDGKPHERIFKVSSDPSEPSQDVTDEFLREFNASLGDDVPSL